MKGQLPGHNFCATYTLPGVVVVVDVVVVVVVVPFSTQETDPVTVWLIVDFWAGSKADWQ